MSTLAVHCSRFKCAHLLENFFIVLSEHPLFVSPQADCESNSARR